MDDMTATRGATANTEEPTRGAMVASRWRPCPDCPGCGHPPALDLGGQAWCGTEGCRVVAWNPLITQAQNMADVNVVDLSPLSDEEN